MNKAIQRRFVELQQQKSSIGRVKILKSPLRNEKLIQNYLDLEEKKQGVDGRMVSNEKLRDDKIAKGEFVDDEAYAAACQELVRKKSDIKTSNDALLKSEDEGVILRSLEDAEQRQADVRANTAVDKSCKTGT